MGHGSRRQFFWFCGKVVFVIVLSILSTGISSQNWCDYNSTMSFANHLMSRGMYEEAIVELQRIHFFMPGDSVVPRLMAKAICRSSNPEHYINELNSLCFKKRDDPDVVMPCINAFIRINMPLRAIELIANSEISDSLKEYLTAICHIKSGNVDMAKKSLSGNREYASLVKFFNAWEGASHRSPFLAGIMSAILPGTGKIYTGYWKDGLFSMLFIGSMAGVSYYIYATRGLNSGWLYFTSIVTFSFYMANIYGSIKSAHLYNKKKYEELVGTYIPDNFCR